jgi:dimethylhistidine N-methyltransferase
MVPRSQRALRPATAMVANEPFAADVIAGLTARPKRLSPKYFYDAAGSALFEQITNLPEYYPTRCELALLSEQAPAMASLFPQNCALVEFGAGSSRKARTLISAATTIEAYVPIDISAEYLQQEAAQLRRDLPRLAVYPVAADFTRVAELPAALAASGRVGFFPGSTIGNFEPHEAAQFMRHAARVLGPGALFIVGVDLVKAPEILYRAYNDAAGVTAKFNLNVLAHINRELGANFDLGAFEHHACWNAERSRIEMHLASTRRQKVKLCGATIEFRAGESIHTENSYKYSIDSFQALARGSGWSSLRVFTDGLFSVHVLRMDAEHGGARTDGA